MKSKTELQHMTCIATYANRQTDKRVRVQKVVVENGNTTVFYSYEGKPIVCMNRESFKGKFYNVAGLVV